MLHSYFRLKDKHIRTLEYIKDNPNTEKNNLYIGKKIKKLNEYQYFFFLNEILEHHGIKNISINTLQLFFEKSDIIINTSEYFSLKSRGNADAFVPFREDWILCKNKNNLESLIDYFLNTKEYPKETLITKLLVLLDKIITGILHPIFTLKISIDEYVEEILNSEADEKYEFLKLISISLDNEMRNVLRLSDSIQEKIDSLSKINVQNENYLITTNDEILKKLYWGLEKNMFIDQNKTTLDQFINVLKLDWDTHNSIIHLEMDNIQFNFFIDSVSEFLKIKIALTFIERAKNIHNKNGAIKAKSIYSSVSKSKMLPKDSEIIRSIFN